MAVTHPATHVLLALRETDPEAFKQKIGRALKTEGSVPKAAEKLGIGIRTLQTWVQEQPELAEGLTLRKPGWGQGKRSKREKQAKK